MVNSGCSIDNFGIGGSPVKVKNIIMLPVVNYECDDKECRSLKNKFGLNRRPRKYKVTIEVIVEEFNGY